VQDEIEREDELHGGKNKISIFSHFPGIVFKED
jgi:hypothetical protein